MQNNELIPSSTDVPNKVQNSELNDGLNMTNPEVENTSTTYESYTDPVQISKHIDKLNLTNPKAENTNTTHKSCTDPVQSSKERSLDLDQQDNARKEAEIETIVESLLEALKEDESPNTEQDKKKIIT